MNKTMLRATIKIIKIGRPHIGHHDESWQSDVAKALKKPLPHSAYYSLMKMQKT